MNYNIKIGDKSYQVEIADINTRPVVALVDGQKFEVTPENSYAKSGEAANSIWDQQKTALPVPVSAANAASPAIFAPLPGTVIEVFVKPGDSVEAGQVILIIEAMKMKNSIRSVRDGIVASVGVSAGQTVSHKQQLVEFKE